ncbi:MAG: glycosyltransferase [Patescibacteria group bacterium]
MKILIATDIYHPNVNGAAYFTYRLANDLAQRGHDVSVICPSLSMQNTITIDKGVKVYGVHSIHLPVYEKFRISPLIISKRTINKLVEKISPDIIHIQNHFIIGKAVTAMAKKLDIPIIGTNHFMPENLVHYFHMPIAIEKLLIKIGWKQCIKVFNQLDYVTTPTITAANLLKKAGYEKEILPLSCGINLNKFKPTNDGLYLKERYHIPTNKKIILYVGRLDKEKRVETIIQSLPIILKQINAHLVLAGLGKERPKLENLTQKLNIGESVTFTGFIPDVDLENVYHVGDVFVIAGVAELQSIVTMEALASGLPVVAVNAMALPELVHDGENGYLFDDGNSEMIANHIIKILSNDTLKRSMQEKSLEIIQTHAINKTLQAFESIYDRVIKEHQKNSNYIPTWTPSKRIIAVCFTASVLLLVIFSSIIASKPEPKVFVRNELYELTANAKYFFNDSFSPSEYFHEHKFKHL